MPHPRDAVRNAPVPRPEKPKQPGNVVHRTNPRHVPFVGTRRSARAAARVETQRPPKKSTQPETPRFGRAARGQLPTLEQYVARGYEAEDYETAMENYRRSLRAEGITPIEPQDSPHT
jgi:hypothetical protein